MSWEMEYDFGDACGWQKAGFSASGGFIPYRFERKDDAERELQRLHPKAQHRIVPATSICADTNGEYDG